MRQYKLAAMCSEKSYYNTFRRVSIRATAESS